MTNLKEKTTGEVYWIIIVRILALIIGFLPFIPNALWYLGITNTKHPIDTSDMIFVGLGFIFLWGSANFGTWANALGRTLVNRFKKE